MISKRIKKIIFLFFLIFLIGIYSCGKKSLEKNEVIKIALKNNLEKGIDSLKAKLIWDENHQKKVWVVVSTLTETQTASGYSAVGEGLIIDPENGKILKKENWVVR